jgi:hypothetical protein
VLIKTDDSLIENEDSIILTHKPVGSARKIVHIEEVSLHLIYGIEPHSQGFLKMIWGNMTGPTILCGPVICATDGHQENKICDHQAREESVVKITLILRPLHNCTAISKDSLLFTEADETV